MIKVQLIKAGSKIQYQIVSDLFTEYASSLGFDLDFQNFKAELDNLPGDYAGPLGCIILAEINKIPAGCVALRKLEDDTCEMKRMFVKPEFRGKGIGKKLIQAIIEQAQEIGYKKIRLDTISTMTIAINIYESVGFKEINPYRFNPLNGARFYELILANS
jgi:ribosomal protein S18 acetylase RimI-like enzyme